MCFGCGKQGHIKSNCPNKGTAEAKSFQASLESAVLAAAKENARTAAGTSTLSYPAIHIAPASEPPTTVSDSCDYVTEMVWTTVTTAASSPKSIVCKAISTVILPDGGYCSEKVTACDSFSSTSFCKPGHAHELGPVSDVIVNGFGTESTRLRARTGKLRVMLGGQVYTPTVYVLPEDTKNLPPDCPILLGANALRLLSIDMNALLDYGSDSSDIPPLKQREGHGITLRPSKTSFGKNLTNLL